MLQMVLKIFSHRQDSNYAGGKATETSQRNKTKEKKEDERPTSRTEATNKGN